MVGSERGLSTSVDTKWSEHRTCWIAWPTTQTNEDITGGGIEDGRYEEAGEGVGDLHAVPKTLPGRRAVDWTDRREKDGGWSKGAKWPGRLDAQLDSCQLAAASSLHSADIWMLEGPHLASQTPATVVLVERR